MKLNTVIIIDGIYYQIRAKDSGFPHPEDSGLWRAVKVRWSKRCYWECYDDDDWMISDDGDVVAREIGWNLRREKMK